MDRFTSTMSQNEESYPLLCGTEQAEVEAQDPAEAEDKWLAREMAKPDPEKDLHTVAYLRELLPEIACQPTLSTPVRNYSYKKLKAMSLFELLKVYRQVVGRELDCRCFQLLSYFLIPQIPRGGQDETELCECLVKLGCIPA